MINLSARQPIAIVPGPACAPVARRLRRSAHPARNRGEGRAEHPHRAGGLPRPNPAQGETMIRTLHRLGDRLLERLLPGAEAQADNCFEYWPSGGCNRFKDCYPNPTGFLCITYWRSSCGGAWQNIGYC